MIKVFSSKDEWLEERHKGLGGTDIAAILGVDKYTSPFQVWWEKTHPVNSTKPTIAMRRGHALEPIIVEEFADKHPEYNVVYNPGVYELAIWDEDDCLRGTRDALFYDDQNRLHILEAKSTAGDNVAMWYQGVPTKYKLQVQVYIILHDADGGVVAALINDQYHESEITLSKTERDVIVNTAKRFWHEHVLTNIPPEAITLDDVKKKYREFILDSVMLVDEDFLELLDKYDTAKTIIANLEDELKKEKEYLEELAKIIWDKFGRYEYAQFQDKIVAQLRKWGTHRRLEYKKYLYNTHTRESIIDDKIV